MKRIYQLPAALANQIAAGEVIERPASVVKELLENTWDAQASLVTIDIGYGGLNAIKISDNGMGILADDLPLAIAPHATSKIRQLDDLYAIDSMGFRGEALASIASIAKVTISSKPATQAHAMQLRLQDGHIEVHPCARSEGTTVEVLDIFYNAPVRKRFLKSEKLEFQAIETIVKRFALSAQTMEILLKHNDKQILHLPAASNEKAMLARVNKLLGSGFSKEALRLDFEKAGLHLQGWLSGPQDQRSQNDRVWVYINKRMVKDKLIHHAIRQAYEGLLYPGRFPSCLLYLTIDTKEVDVNVHPTKHEVRFQQPRLVHDFLRAALSSALEPYQTAAPVWQASRVTEKTYSAPPLSNSVKDSVPWVTLDAHYALLWLDKVAYVVDVLALRKDYLWHQLNAATAPLAKRRLLLPQRLEQTATLLSLQPWLSQAGLEILCEGGSCLLQSIPQLLPNLDCRKLFAAIEARAPDSYPALLQLLCQSHSFDMAELDVFAKQELENWLRMRLAEGKTAFCRKLAAEDCHNYVYG